MAPGYRATVTTITAIATIMTATRNNTIIAVMKLTSFQTRRCADAGKGAWHNNSGERDVRELPANRQK